MNYLGIDYGEKRIGLSYADELGIAYPLPAATQAKKQDRLEAIAGLIQAKRIDALVIGYPYNMDGSVGPKAQEVDGFIAELEARFGLPVHRVDERLTSEYAAGLKAGKKGKSLQKIQAERRSGELDSRAAAVILQDFLDAQAL